ncbi:MAG: DNA-binding protein WhiA [Clostridia bacterium]|nr:DNA-binding protein WhiA [Clostridia bacterium]
MSFCSSVKSELLNLRVSGCCRQAFCYGFMLFGRAFSIKRIALQTANEEVARGYANAIFQNYKIKPEIKTGGSKKPTFVAEVISEADRLKILAQYDFGMSEELIDDSIFLRDCCFASFVRGAFLSCGNINDPEKEYRLEFNVKTETIALELQALLLREGISLKSAKNGKGLKLYTKDSAVIEDLLTFMGASKHSLEIMDTKVIKSVKNSINRARNCDSANISKTVEASIRQRRAIEFLKSVDRLESLPEELLQAAKLRLENPEATLKELVRLSSEPLTISGLNHRFQKIIEIYEEMKN